MKLHRLIAAPAALFLSLGFTFVAHGQTLRIAEYNVNADTDTSDPPGSKIGTADAGPGLAAVLQAIGQEKLDGHAQPLDVLALEELNDTVSNGSITISQTLSYITGQLNSIYGAGTYAYDTFIDDTTDTPTNILTGNGPNGLIYNTHTVVDLGATQIGTPSSSGAPRAPMRYLLKPVGGAAYTQFYLYVSHAKSGSGSTGSDADRRNDEAVEVRADAATLGSTAHVIYTGDWNINDSSEQTYKTLIASTPSSGQAIDTANPANNWTDSASASAYWPLLTESAPGLQFRDDLQLVTSPTVTLPGLQLVTNTLTPFGNNGTAGYGSKASVTSSSNTALSDLSNRSTILTDLTTDTDHLPTVADYVIVPPGDFTRDQQVNSADVPAMLSALANLPAYESSHGLTDSQVLAIGDVNGDGVFNNADVQALLMFLAAGHGTGAPAPEPATAVLLGLAIPAFVILLRRRLGWRARR